jgi:hypothetical protein
MAARPRITLKVDTRQLEKTARKAAKAFGENSHDATARLGLQAARGLSGSTEAFGRSWKKTQAIQRGAIVDDMGKVFQQVPAGKGVIDDVGEAAKRYEKRRVGHDSRPKELPTKIRITPDAFTGLMMMKFRRAGMAKSAWIGAARHLERKQGKGFQIRFGKAYTPYLKRWESMGSGTKPKKIFSTSLILRNSVAHVGKNRVLKRGRISTEIEWAQKKTIKWYEKATAAKLAKLERESLK